MNYLRKHECIRKPPSSGLPSAQAFSEPGQLFLSCLLNSPWPSHISSPHLEPHRSRDQAPASASTWMEASGAQGFKFTDHCQLWAKCKSRFSRNGNLSANSILSTTSKGNKGLKQWLKGQLYLQNTMNTSPACINISNDQFNLPMGRICNMGELLQSLHFTDSQSWKEK